MRWCLFVCLWLDHEKYTEPISAKFRTKTAYLPGSDPVFTPVFPIRYLSLFKDGGLLVTPLIKML